VMPTWPHPTWPTLQRAPKGCSPRQPRFFSVGCLLHCPRLPRAPGAGAFSRAHCKPIRQRPLGIETLVALRTGLVLATNKADEPWLRLGDVTPQGEMLAPTEPTICRPAALSGCGTADRPMLSKGH
jgi:hypothetical protein